MQLSVRLKAVAELAKDAENLADIGTDHGYLAIYLAQQGRLAHAIAMDVNTGPLQRAKEHIRLWGMEEKIETRLSDGAHGLRPGEADTVVIAGMGGALTIKILSEGRENLSAVRTFVLQPQSEIALVRRFLQENGFAVVQENMVKDEGKYYPMMKAVHGRQEPWTEEEYRFGRLLIESGNPCLMEYLEREEKNLQTILDMLAQKPGENIRIREEELRGSLALVQRARERMGADHSG